MKTKVKSIRMSEEICTRIEDRAILENRNFSNMVETLLLKVLNNDEKIAEQINK